MDKVCQFYIILGNKEYQGKNDGNVYINATGVRDINLIKDAIFKYYHKKSKENIKVSNRIIFLIPDSSLDAQCQMIIDQLHDSLGENQGIIEVRSGKTASGKPFVFDILKMSSVSKEGFPMGMSYILNINVKMDKSIQFINGSFSEEGMTGMRDSVCFAMFRQSNSSESEDLLDGWFRDPYDSNYTKGLRMNFSEQEGLDEKFPWHPLSELRRLVKYIIENN